MAGAAQKRDYYEVLGVPRTVDAGALKSAFRKVALQYHPDRNPGDKAAEDKFKEASEAYEVLSDPERRARYDRFGHQGDPFGGAGGPGFQGVNINDIFGDLFGEIFGGARGGGGARARGRGADLRYNLEVSFEEAAFGCEVKVPLTKPKRCEVCEGTGSKQKEAGVRACPTCAGSGEQRFTQGFFAVSRPCADCSGTGSKVTDPCGKCRGAGRYSAEQTLDVRVPGGVDTGVRLRLTGQGEPGERGGPAGDLYVTIHVREHSIFTREEHDVMCEVPISFTQAALGATVEVPTLDGKMKLKVRAGTQSGKVETLRGKGIPHLHGGGRGDQLIRWVVETPTELSAKQRELLEQFADLAGEDVHPQRKTFFSKVRELFG
jgi:molecular chaperone DnaJ